MVLLLATWSWLVVSGTLSKTDAKKTHKTEVDVSTCSLVISVVRTLQVYGQNPTGLWS